MGDLERIVADVLALAPAEVAEDTGAATTSAWTSMRQVQIVVGVQQRWDVRLSPREARACRSVRAVRDVLTEKGVAA